MVLNDNGWSISENVGWIAHWRNRFELHPVYKRLTEKGHGLFKKLPKGEEAWGLAKKIKNSVEGLFFPNLVWDELGFHYVGPIDGHDYKELEEALARAKEVSADGTPVVIHALTHKGRGYDKAEENPSRFHQPGTPSPAAVVRRGAHVLAGLREDAPLDDGEGPEDRRDHGRDAGGDRPRGGPEGPSRRASSTSGSPRSTP